MGDENSGFKGLLDRGLRGAKQMVSKIPEVSQDLQDALGEATYNQKVGQHLGLWHSKKVEWNQLVTYNEGLNGIGSALQLQAFDKIVGTWFSIKKYGFTFEEQGPVEFESHQTNYVHMTGNHTHRGTLDVYLHVRKDTSLIDTVYFSFGKEEPHANKGLALTAKAGLEHYLGMQRPENYLG